MISWFFKLIADSVGSIYSLWYRDIQLEQKVSDQLEDQRKATAIQTQLLLELKAKFDEKIE